MDDVFGPKLLIVHSFVSGSCTIPQEWSPISLCILGDRHTTQDGPSRQRLGQRCRRGAPTAVEEVFHRRLRGRGLAETVQHRVRVQGDPLPVFELMPLRRFPLR